MQDAAPSALAAQRILRDPSQFQWYVIPLFALVVYVYACEVQRKAWGVVFAGMALFAMDLFNEIWNGLVFHFTRFAPVWGAPGKTAYLLLIGLNLEIAFMFSIAGISFTKMLPEDRAVRVLGLPNRWVHAGAMSAFCVGVEILLNRAGALTWEYPWWSARFPLLIFLVGYLPFFVVAFWVHDLPTPERQGRAAGTLLGVVAALGASFGLLGWI